MVLFMPFHLTSEYRLCLDQAVCAQIHSLKEVTCHQTSTVLAGQCHHWGRLKTEEGILSVKREQ